MKPTVEEPLTLHRLGQLPTPASRVRAMYAVLTPLMPEELVGPFRDVRSAQLATEAVEANEPVLVARDLVGVYQQVRGLQNGRPQRPPGAAVRAFQL